MHSRKFWVAVILCVALVCCAMLGDGLTEGFRLAVLAMATAVACVWIVCEARVDRAAAPLNLPDVPEREPYEPPEDGDE